MSSRDIKFRVWDKEQKRFLEINWEGEDTRHTKGKANICYSDHVYVTLSGYVNEDGWPYEVDADILQHIGLKDKNGKEIYEGDIIKYSHQVVGEILRKVRMRYGMWGIEGIVKGTQIPFANILESEYEVVGNIYENPELLEGE